MIIRWAYTLFHVWGIPIRAHITLLVIVPVLLSNFNILMSAALAICAFGSIVLHELGHCFVAMRKGCRIREILLMPIGGAAQMEAIPRRPRDEFLMAVAGPLVSLTLSALSFALLYIMPKADFRYFSPPTVVSVMAVVNLALVLFNLLPAFPMDGGRVLRALLSTRIGRLRATYIASRLGRYAALLFAFTGFFVRTIPLFGGIPIPLYQGFLLVVIAVFIYKAAEQEYQLVRLQELGSEPLFGFGWMPPPAPPAPPAGAGEAGEVIIGPPPYARGRVERTTIHPT